MNSQTALLLIDIQNDYFDGGANPLTGSLEASLKAKDILKFFREQKNRVIHVQHLSTRPGSSFFNPGTHGADIHPNVQPLEDETVIQKHFPNSFRETGLLAHLKSNSITHLVICGMMTHMCVDATVRSAKDFGFECTLISDACATKHLSINGKTISATDVHHSFLAALNYYYASVIPAKEIIEKYKEE